MTLPLFRRPWFWLLLLLGASATTAGEVEGEKVPAAPLYCSGDYAEDFSALSPAARAFEASPQQGYTYCVRTSAVYECPSYAADGSLRRTQRKAQAHGTAFGFRQQNGETLLMTNQHVAEWPAVTDAAHPVDDVPMGCKRVSDRLRIVDNTSDQYELDDVSLTRVVSDAALDVSVLKAKAILPVMPWKIGRSAALRERDVVDVRGFPLGVFKANNVGKVISAYDHDDDKEWDHDDFVIDALLSPGNSGSPVMAVSCKSGELELVGIYHAGYTRGSALNVVVGIDQLRDLMTTLKRAPKAKADANTLDAPARSNLLMAARDFAEPFFPFGNLIAAAHVRADDTVVFEVFSRDFPLRARPVLVIEDLPKVGDGFGELGRVFASNAQGLAQVSRTDLDADTQGQLQKILEGLRSDALAAFTYRSATHSADTSHEHFNQTLRLERAVRAAMTSHQDLGQATSDLADRLAPSSNEPGLSLADVLRDAPAAPVATVARGSVASSDALHTTIVQMQPLSPLAPAVLPLPAIPKPTPSDTHHPQKASGLVGEKSG